MDSKILFKFSPGSWLRAFFFEAGESLVQFPKIYYTTGLRLAAHTARQRIVWYERTFGLGVMVHNLFKPLYNDNTRSGRIIGFFLRFVLLLTKVIIFTLTVIVIAFLFILYGFAPLVLLYLLFSPPDFNLF